ncbi:MAG: rhodanese-like domain-containing protein [Bacteroidota bacterium]
MTGSELFLYSLIALVAFFGIRRFLWTLKIPQYNPANIAEKLSSKASLVLLDVRTNSERRNGAIRDSVHIPLHELGRRMNELEKLRDKEIVVYCQSGNRSLTAAVKLRKNGFSAANLKGGIAEWNFQNRS